MEEHNSTDVLDAVGDSQLSYSADIKSESNRTANDAAVHHLLSCTY